MQNKNFKYLISIFIFSLIFISIILPINNFDIPTVYAESDTWLSAHQNDDATEYGDSTYSVGTWCNYVYAFTVAEHNSYRCSGTRWSVEIPYGSEIVSAYIEIYIPSSSYDDIHSRIFGEKVADSDDYFSTQDVIGRARTTENVNWDQNSMGVGWTQSPDITDVIQEIIDQPAWESGNYLSILLIGDIDDSYKTLQSASYDYDDNTYGWKLTVEWLAPPTVIYPDHVETEYQVTNSSDTLDDDDVSATFEYNAFIVWDFEGGLIGNITAIRWELVHPVTGAMWRLEGSDDKEDWTIIAQMEQSLVGYTPTDRNDSTRYDGQIVTPFRYLKLFAVKGVLSDYWIDYICYIVEPPSINYSYSTYIYPNYLMSWNWEIMGSSSGSNHYASRPYNLLGLNQSDSSANASATCLLVNSDFDADNMAIVRFVDFYNITSMEVLLFIPASYQHAYLYVSSYSDRDWELVWDDTGDLPYDWYGDLSFNATYIRYAKLNGTGIGSSVVTIGGFRIQGELYGGGSPPPDDDDDDAILPSFGDLPDWFALVLGIDVFGAGIFLSGILLMMFLLPIVWYGKSSLAVMIVGVVLVGFLVTITWLPTWIILVIILLIAGMYASKIADWLGSSKND